MKKIVLVLSLFVLAIVCYSQTSIVVSDLPSGGSITAVAGTGTLFNVNQTTAGQTLSLPNPTNTAIHKSVFINNIGSATFTLNPGSLIVGAGNGAIYRWTGAAWSLTAFGSYSLLSGYLKIDGSNHMTGTLNMFGNDISNLIEVYGSSSIHSVANFDNQTLKDGTTDNWISFDWTNRFGKDTLGNKFWRYNKRSQGFGISTTSSFWANLKADSLTSDIDIQMPDSSGQLIVNPTGGYVRRITNNVQFDFNAVDDLSITNDNGGFTKSTLGLSPSFAYLQYNNGVATVRDTSFDFSTGSKGFGIGNSGSGFWIENVAGLKAYFKNNLLSSSKAYQIPNISGSSDTLTTSTNTAHFTNKSGNISQWTNDAKYTSIVSDHIVDAGNSTTVETTLYTDTLAANTFSANGTKVLGEYSINFIASATATRDVRVYFAGTLIFDSGSIVTSLATSSEVTVKVVRTGNTTARTSVTLVGTGLTTVTETDLTSQNFATTNILKVTGQAGGTGAATNDIVAKFGYLEYKPAKN